MKNIVVFRAIPNFSDYYSRREVRDEERFSGHLSMLSNREPRAEPRSPSSRRGIRMTVLHSTALVEIALSDRGDDCTSGLRCMHQQREAEIGREPFHPHSTFLCLV